MARNNQPTPEEIAKAAEAENNAQQPADGSGSAPAPADNQSVIDDSAAQAALATELAKREAALAEREEAAAERDRRADENAAKVDAALAQIDQKLAELNRKGKETKGPDNEEKAEIVSQLQEQAYAGQDNGELVDYTPLVTQANISNAGTIVYEKGVPYRAPKLIVDDLRRRESEHLDYKENLHIRDEQLLYSGTISGGGK